MNQTILITGASSGLGQGMAEEFAAAGNNLALCARRLDQLEALKSELLSNYQNIEVSVRSLDVNNHQQVFEVFDSFAEEFGSLDRIIVNAGVGNGAVIGTGDYTANIKTAETNFVAALVQCEAAMQIFRKQQSGHLVTISSVAGVRGLPGTAAVYSATKAALSSLTESLAIDMKNKPIKVTCINPGFIRTEINESLKNTPFIVDKKTGCKAMVMAIEKQTRVAWVPYWPWAFLQRIMRVLPANWLAFK